METPDDSYRLLACCYLQKQLYALTKELEGSQRAEDTECVHQARVASRRMRAGLAMFDGCFPPKMMKKWGKRISNLTRRLGIARDTDVQIEYVENMIAGLDKSDKKNRPGLNRLALRLRQRREAIQANVVKTIHRIEAGQMLSGMHGELAKTLFDLKRRKVPAHSPYLFVQTERHIGERIRDLFFSKKSLEDPQDASGHHQFRIAAKKLRYTMEICNGPYEKRLNAAIKAVKKLQSLLGEIHDCDVWEHLLDTFLVEERQRMLAYYGHDLRFSFLKPGLRYIQEERKATRESVFKDLVERWKEMEDNGFWGQTAAIVESRRQASDQVESEGKGERMRCENEDEASEDSCN